MRKLFQKLDISNDKKSRADADILWAAVFIVLTRYQRDGKEPGAEHWQADTRWKRPLLIEDIRTEWLSIIGGDYLFPWSDDFVIDIFVSQRKATRAAKVAICEELGIEIPAKWAPANEELDGRVIHAPLPWPDGQVLYQEYQE